jgi:UDP-glucose 4-epimerase
VKVHIADVRDWPRLPALIKGQDFLFNLAGQTSHLDSMTDPQTDLDINCRAQLAILEACRQHNPAIRIVFASTRQIYGKPDAVPVAESHPLRPVDINGINKLAGESFHLLYARVHGTRATALRLTNTIGPRMRIKDARQTFVGVWIRRLLEGAPIEVWVGNSCVISPSWMTRWRRFCWQRRMTRRSVRSTIWAARHRCRCGNSRKCLSR